MKTLSEFLDMGGYGAYVWSSYGLCFAILAWNILSARHQAQQTEQRLKRRLQHQEKVQ